MPDMNAFPSGEKSAKQLLEFQQDNNKLIEEACFDSPAVRFLADGQPSLVAPAHSHKVLNEADNALKRNDIQEAAYQLRREVDFCNAVPKMAGSPYEKSGKAGLEALNKHESAAEIDQAMKEAWDKAWAENPAPFYNIDGVKK